jgi:peroxiredoxin Q/BCP
MRGVPRRYAGICLAVVGLVALACRERSARAVDPGAADTSVSSAPELKVGDAAPDFSLPGSDGRVYSLKEYRGRQAIVLAWFAKAFTSA